ncbi:zinc metalloprotease EGY, chloroplastic [Marchantia polymorpha subsp. ruderalis]|uniref:Peptidase M50 domain-containing protein n=2 Tax=Marchantia polymorpha TaxID=3197 RepID=A0A176W2F3_MARPO|nr:hypothetical protein AXG93_4324s1540 [Marchantia polymorpha subsp. ruderalis]PTQ42128.1 hypothetical protein MARPO_0031s0097 [Marchantia polymorpha]PTQ42129.1 hypothetical protein MARPO_0031s0097 [Marchantia polymorpha]BBN01078.1 hypothetical protein Mp_2g04410 [Marchantia polymorpha subsp. ruderalis]BBN01079.1 hypothetical protein Mp_2g04410 [Marchantia polymorpha subsp. ruderalis]|eukprot:PTQ42128.1 hypothetical protein MARPO_0031s0097 [Marchantia polymorpha]
MASASTLHVLPASDSASGAIPVTSNSTTRHVCGLARSPLLPQRRQAAVLQSKIWGCKVRGESRQKLDLKQTNLRQFTVAAKEEDDGKPSKSPSALMEEEEKKKDEGASPEQNAGEKVDWRKDEDMKKFLTNPSIETLLKVESKRTEQRLKELESLQDKGNVFTDFFNNLTKSNLRREKERLEKAQETFKALDIGKLKSVFGYDSFYATDARRFGDGAIFVGNMRKPLDEVKPKLEAKLSEVAGREVDIWFMEETPEPGVTKQICVVQPKVEIDLQLSAEKLSTPYGYLISALLGVTTLSTIALTSGFFLPAYATFDDYVSRVLPLFAGFVAIITASEVATRLTAAKYGVKLSPSFLIPSTWTGCLGVQTNFESLVPSKKALFDIPAARITSAYLTSFAVALTAFAIDGSINGGDNALYIRPQFFFSNPLLSFVQYVTGPYTDELGNVLPQAVEGLGVPVDPLAFAGLLGIVVTSLNMLPCGKLEGGRITQALFGRRQAKLLSFFTSLALGAGGLSGSVLCLVWAFFVTFFRGGEELPAQDEITPVDQSRYVWGFALALICALTLFPNSAGTFPSPLYTPPFFRNDF